MAIHSTTEEAEVHDNVATVIAPWEITDVEGRLEATGLGQTQPVDSNDTPEGRQNNRRVELVRL